MKARSTRTLPFTLPLLAMVVAAGRVLAGDNVEPAKPAPVSPSQTIAADSNVLVYAVNKQVSAFPTNEDLSTPEAAYATVSRLFASGDKGFWRRLSAPDLAKRMPIETGTRELSQKVVTETLNTEVLEVRIYSNRYAAVIAGIPGSKDIIIDLRSFERVADRWLNTGQSIFGSIDAARARFARINASREVKRVLASRPAVANPEQHLKPFVEFLEQEGTDPETFLLHALTDHTVVILGEVHNRPRYWALNTSLVRSPEFSRQVGVIYLEFPINDQPLVDRFLAAPTNDPSPVIDMLRDMFEMGWPDQPTVEFCQAVWEANQTLPQEQRLRIELVDMERPWQKIKRREDWWKYDVDRNAFMAGNILRDLREHGSDSRHALFIVGWMHAMKNMTYAGGEPIQSAGRHLQAALGETNVLAVFPHCPVMANNGAVNGRLTLGLFDSAFAALNNRPLAFPLDHGPFGELPFDASMDFVTTDPYRAGFDAFLYLGPLEDEIMSPLVPGFYTDEYAREVDRRCRLMNGEGLSEVSGASLIELRSQFWGQPRRGWQALGPLNAWHYGSDWEKRLREAQHQTAVKDSDAIKLAAQRLFDAIRQANYEHPGDWHKFPASDVDYTVRSNYPGWMKWICQHFHTNPIVKVELGEVTLNAKQIPELDYTLTLQNGRTLEGTLPFRWNTRSQRWGGVEGLDWHRR